jgi:hypothetical protein
VSAIVLAGYSWIGFKLLHSTEHHDEFGLCLFKNLTGMPCPSCGITRSIIQLYHGHFTESLLINPLGLMASFILLVAPVWIGFDLMRGKETLVVNYRRTERFVQQQKVYLPLIALLILNWFWNIEKGL